MFAVRLTLCASISCPDITASSDGAWVRVFFILTLHSLMICIVFFIVHLKDQFLFQKRDYNMQNNEMAKKYS